MGSEPVRGVPQWFKDKLHDFDDKLRCRWGRQDDMWRVERKVTRGQGWMEFGTEDDMEMMRDGYVLCLRFRQNQMDNRVFYTLFMGDMHRIRKYADQMEEREKEEIMAKRKRYSDENEYAAKQWWTTMNSLHPKTASGGRDRGNLGHWG